MFSKYFVPSFGSPLHHLGATSFPPFPQIVFLKSLWLSTSIPGNDSSTGYPVAENTCLISDFFLNECGLCQSEISAILKQKPSLIRTRSTSTAQQVVRLLRDSGFTDDRIAMAFSWASRLISCSVEKLLSPNTQYLQNLFGSAADVSRVFKWAPSILVCSNMPQVLEKKMKHLATFGLPEDEIKELFRRYPIILKVSMVKVQKNMEFFMHTAGFPAKFVLSYPDFVSCYSLECRIKPRHKVLTALSAMQPSKRPPSLIKALKLSDRRFLEDHVYGSPHATELLELYSAKPALL